VAHDVVIVGGGFGHPATLGNPDAPPQLERAPEEAGARS
jgi:hypothetical protein